MEGVAATSVADSRAAFPRQAAALGLGEDFIDGLRDINVDTTRRLAFACSQPGTPATNDAVRQLIDNAVYLERSSTSVMCLP